MDSPFGFGQAGASSSVPSTIVRAVASTIRARGCDPQPLFARLGIDEAALTEAHGRVPADATARLWHEAPLLVNDPDFGLAVGETPNDALALAAYLFRTSATFGEGMLQIGSYYRVFNDVHPLHVEQNFDDGSVSVVVRTKDDPLPAPRHAVEFAFSWFMSIARTVTGQDLAPIAVRFEHKAPASAAAHARIFRCPVRFDEDASELRFPMMWLALPLPTFDPHLREILEQQAKAELERLPSTHSKTYGARVREIARAQLRTVEPTLETIALRMHMSARTLQRYLKEEGTTFQREIDELRRNVAENMLRENRASLAEIAMELGFADQSAFHKAFVRWTGRTPGDFRKG